MTLLDDYALIIYENMSQESMADFRNTTCNSDFYDVKKTIKAIKESRKRPDTKAIWQYLSNKLRSNIDEDYTGEILKYLINKKILVNKRKANGDSYKMVGESQNKTQNDVVLCNTEPERDNDFKTLTKDTFSNVDLNLDSITKSISSLKAGVMAIKNFIMDKFYNLSRSIDPVKTE